jgi:delta 1-pyrroline-5-carboxylate dehydrogenase
MIDADLLTDALLDPANDPAARKAVEAFAAWDAFPPMIRAACGREARRLAKRAAAALVELLEVAAAADQATSRQ